MEAALQHGASGARLTGGGFGGSVVALVTAGAAGRMRQGVVAAFEHEGFGTPRIWSAHPSAGAHRDR